LEILRKSDVKGIELKGSLKEWYSQYPYKARLKSNSVEFSDDNRSLYKWFSYHGDNLAGESDDEKLERIWNCKFVNSFTRHAYFSKKKYLTMFLDDNADMVDQVMGPISKEHITALQTVAGISKFDYEQKVIRDRLYYTDYNAKITFHPYTHTDPVTGRLARYSWSNPRDYIKRQQYVTKLQNFVEDIVGEENCVKNYCNVYLDKTDIKEVAMYMKLKFPDAIRNVTEVIVIENLNNR